MSIAVAMSIPPPVPPDALAVGIDVAKAELVWATWPALPDGHGAVPNDPTGVAALTAQLAAFGPYRIVCEATGGLERALVAACVDAALPISVVNPRRVHALAAVLTPHAKTDPIDATLLARFVGVANPPLRAIPSPATQQLQALFTRRRQLIAARVAETNQRLSALPVVADSHDVIIAQLTTELTRLDQVIAAQIAADPGMTARAAILRSVPGVGPSTVLALLASFPELGTLTGKQAARLLGVAPRTRESGGSTPARRTSRAAAPRSARRSIWRSSAPSASTR